MAITNNSFDLSETFSLSDEFLYQRYLFTRDQVRKAFTSLTSSEYLAMRFILMASEDGVKGKIYLRDLAEKMQIDMHKTSKMVGNLRDRGFLIWTHDGNGEKGTYVRLTENGQIMFENQAERLDTYYSRVFDRFGGKNAVQLLMLMRQLEDIMNDELQNEIADGAALNEEE